MSGCIALYKLSLRLKRSNTSSSRETPCIIKRNSQRRRNGSVSLNQGTVWHPSRQAIRPSQTTYHDLSKLLYFLFGQYLSSNTTLGRRGNFFQIDPHTHGWPRSVERRTILGVVHFRDECHRGLVFVTNGSQVARRYIGSTMLIFQNTNAKILFRTGKRRG